MTNFKMLYYSVLHFRTDFYRAENIEHLNVAIDTGGLVYKHSLSHCLSPGHEYAYFADPDLYDDEERTMRKMRGKNRNQHLSFEQNGYVPAKPFVAPKRDIQLPLF